MNVWRKSENQDISKAKGELDFFLADNGELKRITFERPYYLSIHNKDENFVDWLYERFFEKNIYSTFTGQEFGEMVDTGYIIDYDGTLADVFVDGFVSNLGLFHNGFKQGKFLVTYDVWKKICDKHEVVVNWANK